MKSYIDLTHLIEEGMPVWPGEPQPEIREPMTLGKDICTVQSILFSKYLNKTLRDTRFHGALLSEPENPYKKK